MSTITSSPTPTGCVNALGWRLAGRTLIRHVRGSRHLLRVPPAIAYDAGELDRLWAWIDLLRVDDTERGHRYECPAPVFAKHRQQLDRGFGRQWFVELRYWTQAPLPGRQLALELAS